MGPEKSKDIVIRGVEYQINKLDALTGSYIAMTVMTKILPAAMQEDRMGLGQLPKGRTELSEQEFRAIQLHCLAVCRRYEGSNRVPMAILTTDGRFAIPEMEYALTTVLGLTFHALVFSLSPFFEEGGLDSVMSLVPDLHSPKAPAA